MNREDRAPPRAFAAINAPPNKGRVSPEARPPWPRSAAEKISIIWHTPARTKPIEGELHPVGVASFLDGRFRLFLVRSGDFPFVRGGRGLDIDKALLDHETQIAGHHVGVGLGVELSPIVDPEN